MSAWDAVGRLRGSAAGRACEHEPRIDAARPRRSKRWHARAGAIGSRARPALPRRGGATLQRVEGLVRNLIEYDYAHVAGLRNLLESRG